MKKIFIVLIMLSVVLFALSGCGEYGVKTNEIEDKVLMESKQSEKAIISRIEGLGLEVAEISQLDNGFFVVIEDTKSSEAKSAKSKMLDAVSELFKLNDVQEISFIARRMITDSEGEQKDTLIYSGSISRYTFETLDLDNLTGDILSDNLDKESIHCEWRE